MDNDKEDIDSSIVDVGGVVTADTIAAAPMSNNDWFPFGSTASRDFFWCCNVCANRMFVSLDKKLHSVH